MIEVVEDNPRLHAGGGFLVPPGRGQLNYVVVVGIQRATEGLVFEVYRRLVEDEGQTAAWKNGTRCCDGVRGERFYPRRWF